MNIFKKILNKILSLFPIPKLNPALLEAEKNYIKMATIGENRMIELTIKVTTNIHSDIIGIKENIATALEEIQGVTDVRVVDVKE